MLQIIYIAAECAVPAAEQANNSPNLFWTIIASAFGGALMTSGVTIWAKFADSKSEHRKWKRETRLKIYSEAARLHRKAYQKLDAVVATEDFDKQEYGDKLISCIDQLQELEIFWGELELVGSLGFEKEMESYIEFINETSERLSARGHNIDRSEYLEKQKTLWEQVIKAARKDLKFDL
ncbi:hypothetical protein [Glutamicibacter sp. TV12E]|uniref:hypothetical protein n=1 Tax=Glutamicibacter sp. TV12E TaxID=3446362 RepID=UPI0040336207